MKFLILGGTGAIGETLPFFLLKKNPENTVYVTSRLQKEFDVNSRVKWVCGNAHNVDFVVSCISSVKPDVIIDFMHYSTNEFKERHETLLKSVGQYLFLSSCRVFSNYGNTRITENSSQLLHTVDDEKYVGTDEYALAKSRQEQILKDSDFLNWTVIRPYITYGNYRFQFQCLEANTLGLRTLQHLTIPICDEMLERKTTLTDGKDVAYMISLLAGEENCFGQFFNCTTSDFLKWDDVLKIYERVFQFKYRIMPLRDYVKITKVPYQIKYDRNLDRIFDNSKILSKMDGRDLTKVNDGLEKYMKGFLANPIVKKPDWLLNARLDKYFKESVDLNGLSRPQKFMYFSEKNILSSNPLVRRLALSVIYRTRFIFGE